MIKDKNYATLVYQNVTGLLRSALAAGAVTDCDDGSFKVETGYSRVTPWAMVTECPGLDCSLWHQVYFRHCGFIPTPCFDCYKIVVRPANLKAAFEFYDLMLGLNYPSKIGWEARDFVFGNFGAYFYNRSIAEAEEKFPSIVEAANEIELLQNPFTGGYFKPVIKRACTEFEKQFGPSDKWVITEEQKLKEKILGKYLIFERKDYRQPPHRLATLFLLWQKKAFSAGDMSVGNYTGGRSFGVKYVTYHKE